VRAAELLRQAGLRVAVITNDQDGGMVDTQFTRARAIPTREVAGGCFCCRFGDMLDAADQLRQYRPDVIFAEPVGSCVDLSATILQPLKAYHRAEYKVGPLTVLVDPAMAASVFRGEAEEHVAYLFRQQLAEADLLCLTKMDRHETSPTLPAPVDFELSALTGQGIGEWLEAVRHGSRPAGARLLEVDYARYAEAEAALGWVNVQADIELRQALSPAMIAGPLVEQIEARLSEDGIGIAHLKVSDRCDAGFVKVSVCRNGEEGQPDGDLAASPEWHHEVTVNLRALGDPVRLLAIVQAALALVDGTVEVRHAGAFRPAPPKPEHHFKETVT
jgi:hypothetical protein